LVNREILILGSNSFASGGLREELENSGYTVTSFDRCQLSYTNKSVTGSVHKLSDNPLLAEEYPVVINYILLKGEEINANLEYISTLIEFCTNKKTKHLIHISSLSVYPNSAKEIDEHSNIELDTENKGKYAKLKVAIDNYLLSFSTLACKISFVRPAFLVSKGANPSLAGILMPLPFGFGLLMGDKNSTLGIVERDLLNKAILQIIKLDPPEQVYIVCSKTFSTKYSFVKNNFNYKIIVLNKKLTLFFAYLLLRLKILSMKQYKQIEGLFKTTIFNTSNTENVLNLNF
jgi:nucleoside-diphosphate-sugar epimerase